MYSFTILTGLVLVAILFYIYITYNPEGFVPQINVQRLQRPTIPLNLPKPPAFSIPRPNAPPPLLPPTPPTPAAPPAPAPPATQLPLPNVILPPAAPMLGAVPVAAAFSAATETAAPTPSGQSAASLPPPPAPLMSLSLPQPLAGQPSANGPTPPMLPPAPAAPKIRVTPEESPSPTKPLASTIVVPSTPERIVARAPQQAAAIDTTTRTIERRAPTAPPTPPALLPKPVAPSAPILPSAVSTPPPSRPPSGPPQPPVQPPTTPPTVQKSCEEKSPMDIRFILINLEKMFSSYANTPSLPSLPSPIRPEQLRTSGLRAQPSEYDRIRSSPSEPYLHNPYSQNLVQGRSFAEIRPVTKLQAPVVPEALITKQYPGCPDMRDYIRKDSIPCWGCKLK